LKYFVSSIGHTSEVLSSLRFVVMCKGLGGQFGFVSQVMCLNYLPFFVLIVDVLESNVGAQIVFWWVNHVLILWLNLHLDFEMSCQLYMVRFVLEFWSELSILWLDLWLDLWFLKVCQVNFVVIFHVQYWSHMLVEMKWWSFLCIMFLWNL